MEASTDTQAQRGGDCGRAIHGSEAMAALDCGGEQGGDGSGGERERRGGRGRAWGRVGGGIEEAGGVLAILSPRRCRRESAAGTRPCSDPGWGNRERRRQGEAGRFGRVGQVAGAVASWAFRSRGEGGVSSFSLLYFLYYFFSV